MEESPAVAVRVSESEMKGVHGAIVPAASIIIEDSGVGSSLWFLRVPLVYTREIGESLVAFSNERAGIAR